MPQEYTPAGSSVAYTIPAYADVVDGPAAFQAFADDVAAGITALETSLAASASSGFSVQTSGTYTLVLADANKVAVEMNNAASNTLVVPAAADVDFPIGTEITVIQTGGGQTTVSPGAGVTVNATPGLKLRAQWAVGVLIKRGTNTWLLTGDITA